MNKNSCKQQIQYCQLQLRHTCQQGHDGKHLCGGAELQNGEQISQIISEHVAGNTDGVQARGGTLAGAAHGVHRGVDGDIQTRGVVVLQVGAHLADDVAVVGSVGEK